MHRHLLPLAALVLGACATTKSPIRASTDACGSHVECYEKALSSLLDAHKALDAAKADMDAKQKDHEARIAKSLADLESSIPRRLDCRVAYGVSSVDRNPEVTIVVPPEFVATHRIVGGGCFIHQGNGHNGAFRASHPKEEGRAWRCIGGDQPNIPVVTKIEGWAIYCGLAR